MVTIPAEGGVFSCRCGWSHPCAAGDRHAEAMVRSHADTHISSRFTDAFALGFYERLRSLQERTAADAAMVLTWVLLIPAFCAVMGAAVWGSVC